MYSPHKIPAFKTLELDFPKKDDIVFRKSGQNPVRNRTRNPSRGDFVDAFEKPGFRTLFFV